MKPGAVLVFVLVCAAAGLAPFFTAAPKAPGSDSFPGWPASFEGAALKQLPLSPIEERFQKNFPGRVGRFTDGRREVILRWVAEGSRKLHPASDCFKANGYALVPQPIAIKGSEQWSGFSAARGTQKLAVRERIYDGAGAQWSDVSAWYWAVQLGQTSGPWWAVTVAENVKP
ncbi:MAG: hypothetical protein V4641_26665 [Pseudomonadota bacterium]